MNRAIMSYSSVHKVRSCFPTLVKPRSVINYTYFAVPDRAVYEDTYFTVGSFLFSYNGTNYVITAYVTPLQSTPNESIVGKVITHDIGTGISDMLLNKVILEAFPDSSWNSYTYTVPTNSYDPYDSTADPYVAVNLRNSPWVDGQGENIINIVGLNMGVKGGLNPFCSVMQTPNVEGTGDRVTFSGDDVYIGGTPADTQGKPSESLVLLAPINTKFRRMVLTLQSSKIAVLQSITVIMSEYTRRGWG